MTRIFSNDPQHDYVINLFGRLFDSASQIYLASPYYTFTDPIAKAAADGKRVFLLVGLNSATSPCELEKIHGVPGVDIRYLTRPFHAKIYIAGDAVLLGSANLTEAGLHSDHEAVICLDRPEDAEDVEEIRALFFEL